jgi:hypothetical protein
MPSFTERRQARFMNRTRLGAGRTSSSATYSQFAADGLQTMSGCARVRNTIFIHPYQFDVPVGGTAGSSVQSGCSTGSLFGSCVLVDISTSAFAGGAAASAIRIPAVAMGAGASPASPLKATAVFAVPRDADTTGSIIAYVDWTYGDAPAQSGCKKSIAVALGYIGGYAATPSGIRTAASTGGASVACYPGTACGLFTTTCLGTLPSFGANDSLGVLVLKLGASAGSEDGTLLTGCVFVTGVRLNYMTNKLGEQSTE